MAKRRDVVEPVKEEGQEVGKLLVATHSGEIHVGGFELPCYVLEDGKRVITQRGLQRAIGMSVSGGSGGAHRVARFVDSILPAGEEGTGATTDFAEYITDLGMRIRTPMLFTPPNRAVAFGYEATILADICDAVLRAKDSGRLQKQQMHIARACEIMLRSFAKIGIIALVDEATGYQDKRERDELQRLLEKYIAKELLPWTKMFPDEFYAELFRLRGWTWKSVGGRRPVLVGKLTNDLVYDRLPKDVVEELRRKEPKAEGRRQNKIHQWLTADFGNPMLKALLIGEIALMRASPDWLRFKRLLERSYPKPGTVRQESLPLGDVEEDT